MPPKLAIVCGGRDYDNYEKVEHAIASEAPTFVIEGGADGADTLARRVCDELMIPHITVWALWGPRGTPRIRKAGYDRNVLMMKIMKKLGGDGEMVIIALPGGVGTNMMKEIGVKNNVRVVTVT